LKYLQKLIIFIIRYPYYWGNLTIGSGLSYLNSSGSTIAGNGTAVAPTTAAKDTSVTIKNGKVVFGSGVTSIKKEDCPDPISRTKLLSTLLKNKITG
jgi:hypothetical protein